MARDPREFDEGSRALHRARARRPKASAELQCHALRSGVRALVSRADPPFGASRCMKFVLFYQSLLSDWNHGNAHFLRGVASELIARGHRVDIYEPAHGWSLSQLLADHGKQPL